MKPLKLPTIFTWALSFRVGKFLHQSWINKVSKGTFKQGRQDSHKEHPAHQLPSVLVLAIADANPHNSVL